MTNSVPEKLTIDKEAPRLKYQIVESEIRRMITTLPVGAKVPPERELATKFDCNFLTVRKALKHLVSDGTITRRIGSGTFVARNGDDQSGPMIRIGVLIHHSGNDYAYRVLQSLTRAGIDQNIELRSGWVDNYSDDALFQANSFRKEGCAAIILPWFPPERVNEVRTFVRNCALPVSLPTLIPGLEANSFECESVFGSNTEIEDVCLYYRTLGHSRIAFLGPDLLDEPLLQKKVTAFVRYTSRENLPSPCSLVRPGTQAMDQVAERWKGYRGDLAVISYDDEHALRFVTAMHKIGLKAPEDYSVLGFNDTAGSRFSDPPLTTIRQNFDYIAHWLIKNAVALSQGSISQSNQIPRLKMIVRSTCGGRDRIDESFRQQMQDLELVVEDDSPLEAALAG